MVMVILLIWGEAGLLLEKGYHLTTTWFFFHKTVLVDHEEEIWGY